MLPTGDDGNSGLRLARDDFARLNCTNHRPQTLDVETRIDQVTSGLVGAQSLQLSSSSCPTDCADLQPSAHQASTRRALYIVRANSVNEMIDAKETSRSGHSSQQPKIPTRPRGAENVSHPGSPANPTCQAHGQTLSCPPPPQVLSSRKWPVSSREGFNAVLDEMPLTLKQTHSPLGH